jgi:2-keto-4-pentenoate hydratase
MFSEEKINQAAAALLAMWQQRTRCDGLPDVCRPASRTEAYALQQAMGEQQSHALFGWKIAATSVEGQRHIAVSGPLAGRLYADRILRNGASVSMQNNLMRVAEIEFAFRFAHALPPRDSNYSVDEVLDAVACVHPSIEVPDSRYNDFVRAGEAQLIADNACANLFVLGPVADDWQGFDYVDQTVAVRLNGAVIESGFGRNVLGDPRVALTWLVNELSALGISCEPGQVVTTGTCRVPVPVKPGDELHADFGVLGQVFCRFF